MIRSTALAFALAVATSAQASPAPLHQADGIITHVRHECGAKGSKYCAKYLSTPLDGRSFRIDCSARFAKQNGP